MAFQKLRNVNPQDFRNGIRVVAILLIGVGLSSAVNPVFGIGVMLMLTQIRLD